MWLRKKKSVKIEFDTQQLKEAYEAYNAMGLALDEAREKAKRVLAELNKEIARAETTRRRLSSTKPK